MVIACPRIEWPDALEERGPADDPSIVLRGTARLGEAPLEIVAIRVDPELRRAPDYRSGVPEAAYRRAALEAALEELEYLAEELGGLIDKEERSIVRLAGAPYVVWMLPVR